VKTLSALETSVTYYQAKQQHIPKERNPQTNGCENVKAFLFVDIW
jgi:hypothetical protein